MNAKKPAKQDDKEQSKLFIEKAREIGADEKHSAADKLMERLAKTKPEPRKQKIVRKNSDVRCRPRTVRPMGKSLARTPV
jgi:hypothetical protein